MQELALDPNLYISTCFLFQTSYFHIYSDFLTFQLALLTPGPYTILRAPDARKWRNLLSSHPKRALSENIRKLLNEIIMKCALFSVQQRCAIVPKPCIEHRFWAVNVGKGVFNIADQLTILDAWNLAIHFTAHPGWRKRWLHPPRISGWGSHYVQRPPWVAEPTDQFCGKKKMDTQSNIPHIPFIIVTSIQYALYLYNRYCIYESKSEQKQSKGDNHFAMVCAKGMQISHTAQPGSPASCLHFTMFVETKFLRIALHEFIETLQVLRGDWAQPVFLTCVPKHIRTTMFFLLCAKFLALKAEPSYHRFRSLSSYTSMQPTFACGDTRRTCDSVRLTWKNIA